VFWNWITLILPMSRRIAIFMTFADEKTNTYAVSELPIQVDWGTKRVGVDMSDTLCRASSNRPITLWVVGKVRQIYFKDRSGTPHSQVAMHVEPFGEDTLSIAGATLRRLSKPPERTSILFNRVSR
jgi:hypothetical protein